MGLIDSHAHVTYPPLVDRIDEIMDRCAKSGVEAVITVGTSRAEIEKSIQLAKRFPGRLFVAAGIHPHEAGKVSDEDLSCLPKFWREGEVVACGEMGLDYHYDFADRETQRRVFGAQLSAARPFDKAIVIHSREALDDTAGLLVQHGYENRQVVFHCFTGTAEEAAILAAHGWRVSFTGIVTFKNSLELQEIAKGYAADQLMVETDSPYLSPEPVRGVRPCEPAFVAHTARFLAALRGVSYEAFCAQTARNTREFFRLPA